MPPPAELKLPTAIFISPYKKTNILAAKIAIIMQYDTTCKRPSREAWKTQDQTYHEQVLNLYLHS